MSYHLPMSPSRSVRRLVALLATLAIGMVIAQPVMIGPWAYVQRTDLITDADISYAYVTAHEAPESTDGGVLFVVCGGEIDGVRLAFGAGTNVGAIGSVTVHYRADGEPAVTGTWSVLDDLTSVGPDADTGRTLLTTLRTTQNLILRIETTRDDRASLTYQVRPVGINATLASMDCYQP